MNSVLSITRRWWWLLFCALCGAGIINTALLFVPVQYTNQAQINLTFDFHASLDWNDISMSQVSDSLGKVFYHPTTMRKVLSEAEKQGVFWSEKQFRQRTEIEQSYYDWIFTVHAPSQQETQTIIAVWSDIVFTIIQNEQAVLNQAVEWQTKTNLLIICLQRLPAEPIHPTCRYGNESRMQTAFLQSHQQSNELQTQSHFLNGAGTALNIDTRPPLDTAFTHSPAWSSIIMFLGALAGFVIGIITLHKNIPDRLFPKRQSNRS